MEAATGAEAISLAGEHSPDVILMDIRLPDMDGIDAARTLGGRPRTARIPLVALSSSLLEGGGEWLLAAGFAGYLEKPISVRDFADQVRRYCGWSQSDRARRAATVGDSRSETCTTRWCCPAYATPACTWPP